MLHLGMCCAQLCLLAREQAVVESTTTATRLGHSLHGCWVGAQTSSRATNPQQPSAWMIPSTVLGPPRAADMLCIHYLEAVAGPFNPAPSMG